MQCDMCGKEEQLYQTEIERGMLNVCKKCSRFGKVISVVKEKPQAKAGKAQAKDGQGMIKPMLQKEIVQVIADDYAELIKKAREKLGLKQEELAKMLAEKESKIQKMESGQFTPSIPMARKIEKYLRIKLIVQHEESHDMKYKAAGEGLTIGDVLQIKKRG